MELSERVLKGSVRRALDVIGDRWTLLILLSAFDGSDRFDTWKARYGVSSSILSSRLRDVVAAGLMEKVAVSSESRRSRYALTAMGEELFPWAVAVWNFERDWIYRGAEHPISLQHRACGENSRIRIQCSHCGGKVTRENVRFGPGPGYVDVPVPPASKSRRSTASLSEGAESSFIGQSVDIIGDRWSFLLLSAAYFGVTRFDDFKEQLDIATNVLSDRLKRFTENGMLARNLYQQNPPRYEYILTEKSIDFFSVPLMLAMWGDKWLPVKSGEAFTREHETCGQKLRISICCERCDQKLSREDVLFSSAS